MESPSVERSGTGAAADAYLGFIDALNRQDIAAAAQYVDVDRYREDCVGFTGGYVGWADAVASLQRVWRGLPDLRVTLTHVVGADDVAIAHGSVTGTALGRLYGAPATKKSYRASYFDFVRVESGAIVERVQQADVLAQMRQLYGRPLGALGVGAMLWRLPR